MPAESSDMLLGVVVLVLLIASVGTWFYLFDHMQHGPILAHEPRRPVPWHGFWALLPVALVVLTISTAIFEAGTVPEAKPETAADLVSQLAKAGSLQLALVGAIMVALIAVSQTTWADLGLPRNLREFGEDVGIGVLAWLASLLPVYGTQLVLVTLFGHAEGHPLIQMIEQHGSPMLFVLAFAAAVVVAPLCEELMFRLVLQGWLEKWEDRELGWRSAIGAPIELVEVVAPEPTAGADASVVETRMLAEELESLSPPPMTGVGGLPYGWFPIGLSSILFALAHVGWGPDPVALFLLALILGYVYQRTHRIVPSIVTHALFNGMALFALWRVMSAGAP
jgi:membrane protease YdiL (CAAX protease family)